MVTYKLVADGNVKSRGMEIERKIEFLESLAGKVIIFNSLSYFPYTHTHTQIHKLVLCWKYIFIVLNYVELELELELAPL